MIHKLYSSIDKILQQIAVNFIKQEALCKVTSTNFNVLENMKDLNEIYVGPGTSEILKNLSAEKVQVIRESCSKFYINIFFYIISDKFFKL